MKTLLKHKYKVLFLVILIGLSVGGYFYMKKKKEDAAMESKNDNKLPTREEAIEKNAPAPKVVVKTERMAESSGDEILVGLHPTGTGGLKENKSTTTVNTAR